MYLFVKAFHYNTSLIKLTISWITSWTLLTLSSLLKSAPAPAKPWCMSIRINVSIEEYWHTIENVTIKSFDPTFVTKWFLWKDVHVFGLKIWMRVLATTKKSWKNESWLPYRAHLWMGVRGWEHLLLQRLWDPSKLDEQAQHHCKMNHDPSTADQPGEGKKVQVDMMPMSKAIPFITLPPQQRPTMPHLVTPCPFNQSRTRAAGSEIYITS